MARHGHRPDQVATVNCTRNCARAWTRRTSTAIATRRSSLPHRAAQLPYSFQRRQRMRHWVHTAAVSGNGQYALHHQDLRSVRSAAPRERFAIVPSVPHGAAIPIASPSQIGFGSGSFAGSANTVNAESQWRCMELKISSKRTYICARASAQKQRFCIDYDAGT